MTNRYPKPVRDAIDKALDQATALAAGDATFGQALAALGEACLTCEVCEHDAKTFGRVSDVIRGRVGPGIIVTPAQDTKP